MRIPEAYRLESPEEKRVKLPDELWNTKFYPRTTTRSHDACHWDGAGRLAVCLNDGAEVMRP